MRFKPSQFWLIVKYLFLHKEFFHFKSFLSIFGLAIGVASLFVSMSVFSGYESTLKESIFSKEGHLMILKQENNPQSLSEDRKLLKKSLKNLEGLTAFLRLNALLIHKKKNSGVILYGIDREEEDKALDLRKRLIKGHFDWKKKKKSEKEKTKILLGKDISRQYELDIGDEFKMIFVQGSSQFSPQVRTFQVGGVLDFGRYDYNSRVVILPLFQARKMNKNPSEITGFYARLQHESQAVEASEKINKEFSFLYWARDWTKSHQNLFEVIQLEKFVIFIILFLMVIAAGVNVSSTLFISVMERIQDISLFKVLGANDRFILCLFSFQGLMIGFLGLLMGFGMGGLIHYAFLYAQNHWGALVGDVYTLERIELELRVTDLITISFSSLLVCWMASLFPAYRGMKMLPSEGLKYE